MAKYIITKQIAVEAESPEEAVAKINEGKTVSFSVSERAQAQAQVQIGRPVLTPPANNP